MSMPEHWLANQMEPWSSAAVRDYAKAYARKHAEKVEAENKRLRANLLIDVGVLNKMTAENATLAAQVGYARKELAALRAAADMCVLAMNEAHHPDRDESLPTVTEAICAIAALLDGQPDPREARIAELEADIEDYRAELARLRAAQALKEE